MRRTLASLSLALLVALPAVAPAAAVEPAPTDARRGVVPSATPEPTPEITPETSPEPMPEGTPDAVTPAPTDAPTDEPGATTASTPEPAVDAVGRPDPAGRYIVVLESGTDTKALVTRHRQREGTRAIRTYDRAIRGFSAALDADQRRALLADPNVVAVVPDELIQLTAQTIPNGVRRIGGRSSSAAAIDGTDQRVDADVAIVDTGIAAHPDLNVAGGYNCSTADRTLWRDKQGHGTHVAGTVGAIDNDFGVVGVAPGVRLWAVKILNDDGYGLLSWYVCGLNWILAQRDPGDSSRPLFEAVNMSVAKSGADDHACGSVSDDILHAAICRVVAGGITVVAAAANDSGSASKRVPAAYNEVITVSALADTDGKAGGLGGNSCYSWGTYDKDDTFANFSNYGADVDLIAPGKCIWSTKPGSTYAYSSGTSMAAPAVTGAVALYKSSRPAATPAEVKEALQYLGNLNWATSTDPDTKHEKLLDVSRIAKLGSFTFNPASATGELAETGGTITIPVSIDRSAAFFERVRLSVQDLPAGWTAAFAAASLMGWTTEATTLTVTVPPGTSGGTYDLVITGVNQARTKTLTVPVRVTNDAPTASAPTAAPAKGSQVGITGSGTPSTVALKVSWAAATDPSSAIVGYELERRVDSGSWVGTMALAPSARSFTFAGLSLGASHTFRVRAQDAAGNWSPWATSVAYRLRTVGDRSSSLTYSGTWKRAAVSSATNAVRTTSTRAGATVATTFTGRGIAVVMPRSSARGRVTIYIDGVKAATVDTYYKSTQARRVVWAKTWKTAGSHRILVRVSGTAGRPTVSLDGLLVTR